MTFSAQILLERLIALHDKLEEVGDYVGSNTVWLAMQYIEAREYDAEIARRRAAGNAAPKYALDEPRAKPSLRRVERQPFIIRDEP